MTKKVEKKKKIKYREIASIEVIKPGSEPDVDSDFNTQIRGKVIDYVSEKYGNVSNINTLATMGAKSAFKAMCTIYEVPFAEANKVSQLIPDSIEGRAPSMQDLLDDETGDFYADAADFRNATIGEYWEPIVQGARALEGRINAYGVHACGVVISSKPLEDVVPLRVRQNDELKISQWTYPELESLGLIKMDFLGLDTVDLIQHTVENIQALGKEAPSMLKLIHGPMDDKKTYELLSRGDTVGVFQLSGDGMRELLRTMKPTEFMDIVACNALYRPGPMGMDSHMKYARRKNGLEKVEYPVHIDFKGSDLEEILSTTYGLIVYQEQIMQIANRIAGMTLQEGDDLRKAMGKKKKDIMDKMMPKFIEGGVNNGFSKEAMQTLWDTVAVFAEYGFNKCLAGRTLVATRDGKKTIAELFNNFDSGKDIEVLSMWENGEIKPHKVKNVVKSGRKPLWKIKTESGKVIRLTDEHRLLTVDGYATILDGGLFVGKELLVDESWTKRLSKEVRDRRSVNMTNVNKSGANREQSREWMRAYQSTLTYEDRCAHQQAIQKANPNRTDNWLKAGQAALRELYANKEWLAAKIANDNKLKTERRSSSNYRGFGKVTQLSNGLYCDSIVEAAAAEYLISRGVDFELHKPVVNKSGDVRISDFYANGIYFEMDGLARGRKYFEENKYGKDVPFVYMTPFDYRDKIDEALIRHNIKNGDKIVEIIPPKTGVNGEFYTEMTYDIEMEDTGPANFIAAGLVSHNSHSVAYAMNGYQSAWLKANYPKEFMAALINQRVGDKAKTLAHLQEAKRMGLRIGPISVNRSQINVSPTPDGDKDFDIVYGFIGLSAVSEETAKIIVDERERNGQFTSVENFIKRCYVAGVNKKNVFENIAYAGGFDEFGKTRKAVIEAIPKILTGSKVAKAKGSSLFDIMSKVSGEVVEIEYLKSEYDYGEKLRLEANTIGLYISGHPMDKIKNSDLKRMGAKTIAEMLPLYLKRGKHFTVVGVPTEITKKTSRGGHKSTLLTIEDLTGTVNARLDRSVNGAIEKKAAQERFKELYRKGETSLRELKEIATNSDFEDLKDPLEKNKLYVFELTRGSNDLYIVKDFRELRLTSEGQLPIRVRLRSDKGHRVSKDAISKVLSYAELQMKKSLESKGQSVKNVNVPIWVARYNGDKVYKLVENPEAYDRALEICESDSAAGKVQSKKKQQEKEQSKQAAMFGGEPKLVKRTKNRNTNGAEEKDMRVWPPAGTSEYLEVEILKSDKEEYAKVLNDLQYVNSGRKSTKAIGKLVEILEKIKVYSDEIDKGYFSANDIEES